MKFVASLRRYREALGVKARDKIPRCCQPRRAPAMCAAMPAIVTERDIMRALAERGAGVTRSAGVGLCQQTPGDTTRRRFRLSRARAHEPLKLRHLAVENEQGEVCGMISSRDLLRLRAQEAAILGDGIDEANDVPELGAAWARLPLAASGLLAEGVGRSYHRRRRLARTRRAHPPRRRAGRAAIEGRRAGRSALPLCACAYSARPGAAKACWRWIRTTPSCSN